MSVRQAQVLTYLALGKRVREIAQQLGVSDESIRRDIRRLEETRTYDSRLKVELEKHCLLWNKAFACIEANLDNGNLKAAEDVMKYTGVWIDRLDVIAKVEPGDQQKKMMKNMEALLKLSSDKVKVALPEKCSCDLGVNAKSMAQEDISPVGLCPVHGNQEALPEKTESPKAVFTNPKTPSFGQIIDLNDPNVVVEDKTKETETQSQLKTCTCGGWGEPPQPKCPIHGDGDKAKARDKESNYLSDCTCPSGRRDPECPYHRYYDRINEGKE